MDSSKIEKFITQIIKEIDDDTRREGLKDTPRRVARSFQKLFGGYTQDPKSVITVFKNERYDEMIICKEIDFYSTCEHHMLPFFGVVHIGYIPNSKMIGISKLPRIVEIYARRLQNQERFTMQIGNTINELITPRGVGVVIEAEHLCMRARGVEKQNTVMTTSSFIGLFKKNAKTRGEFLQLIAR